MTREVKRYSDEFKKQMVSLYNNGKTIAELRSEYGIPKGTLHGWIKLYNKVQSFRICDGMTAEQKRLMELEKENKQLKMEVDILKQAALIMSRK